MWYLSVISILCIVISSISSNDIQYTLSGNTKPLNYNLWLTIDIDRLTFNGTVDITLQVVQETNSIEVNYVNAPYVRFNHLLDGENSLLLRATITDGGMAEQIQYNFSEFLIINNTYVLSLSFSGVINDDLKGLYRSHYIDSNENIR